jgi:hypothetical protein
MRKLVVVQATGKLGLLEVCSNVLVGHLLHAGLKKVGFLLMLDCEVFIPGDFLTSSSDQDLLPPADILRARRLEGSGD